MDRGSQIDVLLGAGSFSDFSDRLEFLNQLQQDDADLAATAESASQRAAWAAEELARAEEQQAALLERLNDKKGAIAEGIEDQKALVDELGREYEQAVARRQAAQEAAAQAASEASTLSPTSTGGGAAARRSGAALRRRSRPRTRSSGHPTVGRREPGAVSTAPASRCGHGRTVGSRFPTDRAPSTPRPRESTAGPCSRATSSSSTARSATSGSTSAAGA